MEHDMDIEVESFLKDNDIYFRGEFWDYEPEDDQNSIPEILKTYPNKLTRLYTSLDCDCEIDLIYSIDDAKILIDCIKKHIKNKG